MLKFLILKDEQGANDQSHHTTQIGALYILLVVLCHLELYALLEATMRCRREGFAQDNFKLAKDLFRLGEAAAETNSGSDLAKSSLSRGSTKATVSMLACSQTCSLFKTDKKLARILEAGLR